MPPVNPFYQPAWFVALTLSMIAWVGHDSGHDAIAYPAAVAGIALWLWIGWLRFGRRR